MDGGFCRDEGGLRDTAGVDAAGGRSALASCGRSGRPTSSNVAGASAGRERCGHRLLRLAQSGQLLVVAASGDRALVRLREGVIKPRPAHGACDLSPFTFDGWTGGRLSMVRATGKAVLSGLEALESPAVISVRIDGVNVDRRGRLNCRS